jgi:hypothetical protein
LCILLAHFTDEPHAFSRQRFDKTLRVATIANRRPRRIDAGAQRRFRNNAPIPKGREQIILAEDALALLNQMDQEIEDLGLKGNQIASPAQLTPVRVNNAFFK